MIGADENRERKSEIAVNTADGKLFTKHTDGSIKTLGKSAEFVADEATALAIALG